MLLWWRPVWRRRAKVQRWRTIRRRCTVGGRCSVGRRGPIVRRGRAVRRRCTVGRPVGLRRVPVGQWCAVRSSMAPGNGAVPCKRERDLDEPALLALLAHHADLLAVRPAAANFGERDDAFADKIIRRAHILRRDAASEAPGRRVAAIGIACARHGGPCVCMAGKVYKDARMTARMTVEAKLSLRSHAEPCERTSPCPCR
mmetsp:Transcript_35349/g.104552  ORF Transcript_35349/g.104552 Transcript_35349/m.104552 type:complete len:200 (-) Transcript_35349:267-866(-)